MTEKIKITFIIENEKEERMKFVEDLVLEEGKTKEVATLWVMDKRIIAKGNDLYLYRIGPPMEEKE